MGFFLAFLLPACAPKPAASSKGEEAKPVPVTIVEAKTVSCAARCR